MFRTLLIATTTYIAALGACGATPPGDKRLLGTWQSDKEGTQRYLSREMELPPTLITKLGKLLLGRMRITYTPSTVILENCEMAGTYRYEIISSHGDKLQLQLIDRLGEKGPISTIQFVSASEFWSIPTNPTIPAFREKFRRVKKSVRR